MFMLYDITSSKTFYFFSLCPVIIIVTTLLDVMVWPIITPTLTLEF